MSHVTKILENFLWFKKLELSSANIFQANELDQTQDRDGVDDESNHSSSSVECGVSILVQPKSDNL